MVVFPNAKINLGLEILRKRADGFHDIDSVFYPIPLCDALELIPDSQFRKDVWHFSGLSIPGSSDGNLCARALDLLRDKSSVPFLNIFLHKAIPMGAGLGGGSSDGTFMLKAINELSQLGFTEIEMEKMALRLGSDCPFFIKNKVARAMGRGEKLETVELNLKGKYLILVCPAIHVSTKEAYSHIEPDDSAISPSEVVKKPIEEWRGPLRNRFEDYAFKAHPELARIKEKLYQSGAQYASMTGSGSAIYGIFDGTVDEKEFSEFGYVYASEL